MRPRLIWPMVFWVCLNACADSREADCEDCDPPGLGDVCYQESLPSDGRLSHVNIETSSVQCRTRTCLTDPLSAPGRWNYEMTREECEMMADPELDCSEHLPEVDYGQQVYCSCRCELECPCDTPGFECRTVLDQGGRPIADYCLRAE